MLKYQQSIDSTGNLLLVEYDRAVMNSVSHLNGYKVVYFVQCRDAFVNKRLYSMS